MATVTRSLPQRIRGRPAVLFVVLTYTISWGVWGAGYLLLPEDTSIIPVVFLGGFGPALAAAVTIQASGGRIRSWLRECLTWRVAGRWYLAAIVVPIGLYGIAAVFLLAFGASLQFDRFGRGIALFLGGLLTATFVSGGNEEFGWRGFLLPRLQRRFDALTASLIVGIVWAGWHLPVYVLPLGLVNGPFYQFVPFVVLVSIAFTWLYNSTGSVLLSMLMHGSLNSAIGVFVGVLATDAVTETVLWSSRTVGAFFVATLLIITFGHRTLTARRRATGTAQAGGES